MDQTLNPKTSKARVERFATAPVLILACLTMDGMDKHPDERDKDVERDLAMQSLAAALQNMLLAAHARVWVHAGSVHLLSAKKPFGRYWRFQVKLSLKR